MGNHTLSRYQVHKNTDKISLLRTPWVEVTGSCPEKSQKIHGKNEENISASILNYNYARFNKKAKNILLFQAQGHYYKCAYQVYGLSNDQ